ncbi:MAG: hypothetical protein WDN24_15760 [Sphingomonas sp.]
MVPITSGTGWLILVRSALPGVIRSVSSAWRFSTRAACALAASFAAGDVGLHPVHLLAHLGHLRLGRAVLAGDAADHDRTERRLHHAVAREEDHQRADAGEHDLRPPRDAEAPQIAAVVEDEIARGEEFAEPRGQAHFGG